MAHFKKRNDIQRENVFSALSDDAASAAAEKSHRHLREKPLLKIAHTF